MATEFARDKQETLKGLQKCIDENNSRRGLGSSRYEELDETGPGYSIRTPRSDAGSEEKEAISSKSE